jgi:2-polyprenyl-3-methyl-5-hydroxy-6-metoxy-1,4-benzoquinol methylase
MNNVSRQSHWENVYATKGESEVSWFEETPALSLELIRLVGAIQNSAIIDIGGGASRLADCLASLGYQDVTVLDLSAAALASARSRIGDKANQMTWIAADVTTWEPSRTYDIWHDRAAFHFLTDPKDQTAYVARLRHGLRLGGHAIIGTFALDGPERCSGLPVSRHDAGSLAVTLGSAFKLIDTRRHEHITPWGTSQKFQFSTFRHERNG